MCNWVERVCVLLFIWRRWRREEKKRTRKQKKMGAGSPVLICDQIPFLRLPHSEWGDVCANRKILSFIVRVPLIRLFVIAAGMHPLQSCVTCPILAYGLTHSRNQDKLPCDNTRACTSILYCQGVGREWQIARQTDNKTDITQRKCWWNSSFTCSCEQQQPRPRNWEASALHASALHATAARAPSAAPARLRAAPASRGEGSRHPAWCHPTNLIPG